MEKELPTSRSSQKIINEIMATLKGKRAIFRGVNKIHGENDEKRVGSSLYIKYKEEEKKRKIKIWNEYFKPPQAEEELVKKARRLFDPKTSNLEVLTDLRHFGAKVNLIDFSYDINIALFFTCNGAFEEPGELIVLPRDNMQKIEVIDYQNPQYGIIEPIQTSSSKVRVNSQKSIFVYPEEGYISKNKWISFKIDSGEKNEVLEHLKNNYEISIDTICYEEMQPSYANMSSFYFLNLLLYRTIPKYPPQRALKKIDEQSAMRGHRLGRATSCIIRHSIRNACASNYKTWSPVAPPERKRGHRQNDFLGYTIFLTRS